MMWFDKQDERALFVDKRRERFEVESETTKTITVDPDILADFTDLPFPDESFSLVVFDPPHLTKLGENGIIAKKYGRLFGHWDCELEAGFRECFRVLKPSGVLVFKWCSREIPLDRVVGLSPVKPLFGNIHGKNRTTHWVTFIKAAVGG